MKVRLAEGLQLVITPESYVEQVALSKWADTVKGECALLVEAYAQQNAHLTGLHCPACTSRNEEIVTCARCGTVKSAPQVA